MPAFRNIHECPVCEERVKRITPHIWRQHTNVVESRYFATLLGNYARLKGDLMKKHRYFKICPVNDCPAICVDIPNHLRNIHNCTRSLSLKKSRKAIRVAHYNFLRFKEDD